MPEDQPVPPTQEDNPKGALAVATGSTNNPVQDSGARGFFTGVLVFIVGYVEARVDVFTDTELAIVLGLIASGILVLGGFWDKYVKPRLPQG